MGSVISFNKTPELVKAALEEMASAGKLSEAILVYRNDEGYVTMDVFGDDPLIVAGLLSSAHTSFVMGWQGEE